MKRLIGVLAIAVPLICCGCAPRHETSERAPAPSSADSAVIAAARAPPAALAARPAAVAAPAIPDVSRDPVAYLRYVRERCAALPAYTLTFTREDQRGLGLFKRLRPPERIACWFRREPFSIRMLWLDPEIKYGESTYVEGQERSRVRFTPRFGILGLKPGIVRVDPMTPVTWGESRGPVTDFGLERLMDKTFDALNGAPDAAVVVYRGRVVPTGLKSAAHHVRLTYEGTDYRTPVQDLYIDPLRHLPVATELWLADGQLDARYLYEDVNADVVLTDADFLIEAERAAKLSASGG